MLKAIKNWFQITGSQKSNKLFKNMTYIIDDAIHNTVWLGNA